MKNKYIIQNSESIQRSCQLGDNLEVGYYSCYCVNTVQNNSWVIKNEIANFELL